MLQEQEPKEKVVKFTGLTPKQIEKLRQENLKVVGPTRPAVSIGVDSSALLA